MGRNEFGLELKTPEEEEFAKNEAPISSLELLAFRAGFEAARKKYVIADFFKGKPNDGDNQPEPIPDPVIMK